MRFRCIERREVRDVDEGRGRARQVERFTNDGRYELEGCSAVRQGGRLVRLSRPRKVGDGAPGVRGRREARDNDVLLG